MTSTTVRPLVACTETVVFVERDRPLNCEIAGSTQLAQDSV